MREAFMRVAFMQSARIPAAEAAAQLAPSLGCTRAFSGGGIISVGSPVQPKPLAECR